MSEHFNSVKKEAKNMAETIGKIPEFAQDGTSVQEAQETEVKPTETETPSESSTEEKPAGETGEMPETSEDTDEDQEFLIKKLELETSLNGLSQEKEKILEEIRNLRQERRDLKGESQPQAISQQQIDELKDLHPEDVAVIERVLKAKGYLSKGQFDQQLYNTVKQEELNKFLDKFPEYKPENDPDDKKWNAFQSELKFYRMPENPKELTKIFDRVHKSISLPATSVRSIAENQRRVQTASLGSGGKGNTQRTSSLESFNQDKVYALRSGGFTDEEIIKALTKLDR